MQRSGGNAALKGGTEAYEANNIEALWEDVEKYYPTLLTKIKIVKFDYSLKYQIKNGKDKLKKENC